MQTNDPSGPITRVESEEKEKPLAPPTRGFTDGDVKKVPRIHKEGEEDKLVFDAEDLPGKK